MDGSGGNGTTRRAGRARRGLSTLGQSVNRITTPALRRRGFAEAAIVTRWNEIVGRPLADHTRPSRVVFPRGKRRDGTLHLTVSGAFATEVQHLSPQIVERINGYFGYGAVARLQLHHGPVAPRSRAEDTAAEDSGEEAPVAPSLSIAITRIGNEPLRAALARLARARARTLEAE